MPRSIRAKRIRQARLRWRVLRFDIRVDGYECGSSISYRAKKGSVYVCVLLAFALLLFPLCSSSCGALFGCVLYSQSRRDRRCSNVPCLQVVVSTSIDEPCFPFRLCILHAHTGKQCRMRIVIINSIKINEQIYPDGKKKKRV